MKAKRILVVIRIDEEHSEIFEFKNTRQAELFIDDLQNKYGDIEYAYTTGEVCKS